MTNLRFGFDAEELSEGTNTHVNTIYKSMNKGELKFVNIGGRKIITAGTIREMFGIPIRFEEMKVGLLMEGTFAKLKISNEVVADNECSDGES